ncbi:MAG: glycerol-3-phosphate dehydrogenase/oxidase [Acidobacteriota bacterium]|nr:MAG: glycerol-3-phosphate dehydrogenase/oxidase [Acidobacteriota bacterium]
MSVTGYYSMPMRRNIAALAESEFDLVVIGAGVYGAAIAWDASLRGLSVALIDKADFGSGTSFNNLKTIHGGIRYLQHADFTRIRESVRERRNLMRIAPHLVHPLPFLVPTYRGSVMKSRTAMRVALFVNDLVSWDRNRIHDRQKHLPAGKTLTRAECLELAPGIESENLTGGVLWHDAQMHNSDRLTLSFVLSAAEEGAVVANFIEATELLRDRTRVAGVRARDVVAGTAGLEIRGKLVVNAAGPWVDRLSGVERRLFHFSKAMNLVTRPVVRDVAVGVVSRRPHRDRDAVIDTGGRFLCLIPWREVTLVGTAHAPYAGAADDLEATEEDICDLLDDVNDAYPQAKLSRGDVRLVHRGLLPMVSGTQNGVGVTLAKSYQLDDSVDGLLSVVGVKYTTARDVAEKAVDRALALIGKTLPRSRSGDTPVVGGDIESFDELLRNAEGDVPEDVLRHLVYTYGSRYAELVSGDCERVSDASPVVVSELRHAVREEMALDLASVVLRRTELGTAGHPGRATLEVCADIMQAELGWSDTRKASELESLETFYRQRS